MKIGIFVNTPYMGLIRLSKDRLKGIRNRVINNDNLRGILKEMVRVSLGEEDKVNWWGFGPNRIMDRVDFRILTDWEEEYFDRLWREV